MTIKKLHRPIICLVFVWGIALILSGCASTRGGRIAPPSWFELLEDKQENGCYYFKVSSESESKDEAAETASAKIQEIFLEKSGLEVYLSKEEDRTLLQEQLKNLILTDDPGENLPLQLERHEWIEQDGLFAYFAYYCIPQTAAKTLETVLQKRYFGSDEILAELLKAAEESENSGRLYQAVEALFDAAGYVLDQDTPLSLSLAEQYAARGLEIFERIEFRIQSYPERVDANSPVEDPFSLRCMEGIIGIRDIEFLVEYKGKKRDGSIGTFEVRMVSNVDGFVNFYHPFLPFSGPSEVVMSPGSRKLKTTLRELAPVLLSAEKMSRFLEENRVTMPFAVDSIARQVSTGIIILHTDMTGANLESSDTTNGLREVLAADGFDVEIMDLSPRVITSSNEQSFLRDLKAAYSGRYRRVVYGVVGINDFDIRNENSYKVETSGIVKVVDVSTGEVLMELEGVKSVESRDNALAVAASFRELGKAFGEELKNTLY